uniref:MbnP family protein n=2 Tax=Pelagicoccus albus TaxID=415222 RepID=UPI001C8C9016
MSLFLSCYLVLMLLGLPLAAHGGELVLRLEPHFDGKPLRLGEANLFPDGSSVTIGRFDMLLSGFALQTDTGQWLDAADYLVGLIRADKGRYSVDLESIPAGSYRAIRFQVGLSKNLNDSDPNEIPEEHALHPVTSGLHWGWTGGYIFSAFEGSVRDSEGVTHGFSYHLANDGNQVAVELPVSFESKRMQTVAIGFDLRELFDRSSGLNPWSGQGFTHSRQGDPLALTARSAVSRSFETPVYYPEIYQTQIQRLDGARRARGAVYPLNISNRLPVLDLGERMPTMEGVALGKKLFEDPVLSSDGKVSCVSCHDRSHAFTDTKALSSGVGGRLGRRNSMPLFNLAWSKHFFWDGRVSNLAEQALHPLVDPNEMGETLPSVISKLEADEEYVRGFEKAFGAEEIEPELIGLAIEQFLLTLVSQDSRFDRAMRGEVELTDQEKEGFSLFVTEHDPKRGLRGADCFHCHGGSLFVSKEFANNGLGVDSADLGRFEASNKKMDTGSFKVPSLRNVAVTAPYMHDGRFASLEAVVEHYNSGVQRGAFLDPNLSKHPAAGLQLTDNEKAALVAFLETLTDPQFIEREAEIASSSL